MKRIAWWLALLPACVQSEPGRSAAAPWSYEGETGPAHWGALDPAYRACAEGRRQSPIDLAAFVDGDLPPITLTYQAGAGELRHNGHTIQVTPADGNVLDRGETTFMLRQFHFHAPSENHLAGRSFPLEAHFVHADSSGALLVLALLFRDGPPHAALGELWAHLPAHAGEAHPLPTPFAPDALLPANRAYYRFAGSLTTPPCTEGVEWVVLAEPVSASAEQVAAFTERMHHPTNRPVQPLHDRAVYR